MATVVVYVVRDGVETFTVEGRLAEAIVALLEELAERGAVRRGRIEAGALRL